jgi:soluble lytic murein transglycosylase-like protein
MAFALCWEESRYTVRAVNRKNSNQSIDRGLFQLNCCSFPDLQEEDFFNPHTNAYYAMAHLRWCLSTGGSEVAALAMYNAGTNRVHTGGTPKKTLDYVSRILDYQQSVEALFQTECLNRWDIPLAMELEAKKTAADQPPIPAHIARAR